MTRVDGLESIPIHLNVNKTDPENSVCMQSTSAPDKRGC